MMLIEPLSFHVLICHLYIFGKVSVKILLIFKIGLFVFLSSESSLYSQDAIIYQKCDLHIFSPFCGLSFHFLNCFLQRTVLIFDEVPIYQFFFW